MICNGYRNDIWTVRLYLQFDNSGLLFVEVLQSLPVPLPHQMPSGPGLQLNDQALVFQPQLLPVVFCSNSSNNTLAEEMINTMYNRYALLGHGDAGSRTHILTTQWELKACTNRLMQHWTHNRVINTSICVEGVFVKVLSGESSFYHRTSPQSTQQSFYFYVYITNITCTQINVIFLERPTESMYTTPH